MISWLNALIASNESAQEAIRAPRRYIEHLPIALKTPAEHEWTQAYGKMMGKLSEGGMLAAFVGEVGPGKTQMAVALLYHAVDQACEKIAAEARGLTGCPEISNLFGNAVKHPIALYAKAASIFHESTDVYRSKDGSVMGLIANYAKPRLLVIDEPAN